MRAFIGMQLSIIKGHPIYVGVSGHVSSHGWLYVLCFLFGLIGIPLILGGLR
jgi:hypothetical protein